MQYIFTCLFKMLAFANVIYDKDVDRVRLLQWLCNKPDVIIAVLLGHFPV